MKKIVGLVEPVKIIGKNKSIRVTAKFDTGASGNSIDKKLATRLNLTPKSVVRIKNASVRKPKKRPVVSLILQIGKKKFKTRANVEDRRNMKYKFLIGRRIIHSNFIIDVAKSHKSYKEGALK